MSINQVTLLGNITRDPEVSYTPKGTAICQIGMALNRFWMDNGQKKEEVTFVDIEAFGKTAETIGKYVQKGDKLAVVGHLKLDSWDDKQSGKKRSKLKVVADQITLLGEKRSQPSHTEQRQAPPPQRQSPPSPPADPDLDSAEDDVPF